MAKKTEVTYTGCPVNKAPVFKMHSHKPVRIAKDVAAAHHASGAGYKPKKGK